METTWTGNDGMTESVRKCVVVSAVSASGEGVSGRTVCE